MGSLIASYADPKVDEVQMRHPTFPPVAAPLVFDRMRFKSMETLPRGVRLVHHWSKQASNITFVYEEPPTMRLIHYMKDEFYFPTPWVVYFLTVQNNRMWVDRILYNTESISSLDTPLKIPVLPNVYIEEQMFCKVCPASEAMTMLVFRDGAVRYDLTMASAIASFWASHFNEDITTYRGYLPMPYVNHSFTGMENLDETTVCDVPWASAASIKHIISQMEWGTAIQKYERGRSPATSQASLYQEFNTAIQLDTYDEIMPGAPRGHDEECDCDDCSSHDEDCDCESCTEM